MRVGDKALQTAKLDDDTAAVCVCHFGLADLSAFQKVFCSQPILLCQSLVERDNEVSLTARVASSGSEAESQAVQVLVDNTEPVASVDIERFDTIDGDTTVPVTIDEANVSEVRLLADGDEIATATEAVDELDWDTTTVESRSYYLTLEVTDVAGHVVESEPVPVVVVNNGRVLSGGELEYIPSAWVSIPDPFDPLAEFHTRISADMDVAGGYDPTTLP